MAWWTLDAMACVQCVGFNVGKKGEKRRLTMDTPAI